MSRFCTFSRALSLVWLGPTHGKQCWPSATMTGKNGTCEISTNLSTLCSRYSVGACIHYMQLCTNNAKAWIWETQNAKHIFSISYQPLPDNHCLFSAGLVKAPRGHTSDSIGPQQLEPCIDWFKYWKPITLIGEQIAVVDRYDGTSTVTHMHKHMNRRSSPLFKIITE